MNEEQISEALAGLIPVDLFIDFHPPGAYRETLEMLYPNHEDCQWQN